jgi:small subunit ribosomal protein S8
MSFNDPLADMLTRIRNGQMAKLAVVDTPYSKLNENVLKVLEDEGYIKSFSVKEVRKGIKEMSIALSYYHNKGVIKKVNKVTKPGLRVYYSVEDLRMKKFYNGLGMYIVSTSRGVISDKEARNLNIGGEVLCNVY